MSQFRSKTLVTLFTLGLLFAAVEVPAFYSQPSQLRHIITRTQSLTTSACSLFDFPDVAAPITSLTLEAPDTVITVIVAPVATAHANFDDPACHLRAPPLA